MDFFSDGNIYAVGKISRQGSGLPSCKISKDSNKSFFLDFVQNYREKVRQKAETQ